VLRIVDELGKPTWNGAPPVIPLSRDVEYPVACPAFLICS
jgi:hypothetical protein